MSPSCTSRSWSVSFCVSVTCGPLLLRHTAVRREGLLLRLAPSALALLVLAAPRGAAAGRALGVLGRDGRRGACLGLRRRTAALVVVVAVVRLAGSALAAARAL